MKFFLSSTIMKLHYLTIVSAALALGTHLEGATTVLPTSSAFATSGWGVPAAPYRRDSWSGGTLGVSNADPFGMGEYMASPEGGGQTWQTQLHPWEETTYLVFDPASFSTTETVASAVISVTTVARAGAPADIAQGMTVSAHSVNDDPLKILATSADPGAAVYDPTSSSYNPALNYQNNYGTFQTTQIGDIVATFVHGGAYGTYTLDITALVNTWLANPTAPGAFSLALTGTTEGNDPDAWVSIYGQGTANAPTLTLTTVPEAGSATLIAAAMVAGTVRRRRR